MSPSPLFTFFLKFGAVGGSGVIVNLAFLAGFRELGCSDSLASAMAIEVSILSNFMLNERWTFRDRLSSHEYVQGALIKRAARFQLVSLIGAIAQWVTFLIGNVAWAYLGLSEDPNADPWTSYAPLLINSGWQAMVMTPPKVGNWIYLSQLIGIAVATVWNFLVNYYWTWGERKTS